MDLVGVVGCTFLLKYNTPGKLSKVANIFWLSMDLPLSILWGVKTVITTGVPAIVQA